MTDHQALPVKEYQNKIKMKNNMTQQSSLCHFGQDNSEPQNSDGLSKAENQQSWFL